MRHRRRGRKLGRNPKHQRALLRNLAASLILTERDSEDEDNAPQVKGRIVTTLQKAKEVRPLVERCVTIAQRSIAAEEDARQYATDADRGSDAWRRWRQSDQWQKWNQAIAPVVAARRRVLQILHHREAVTVLFDDVAPRFIDRDGGYTRILRLAQPRLGDGGTRAILEFVGVRDRVVVKSQRPAFESPEEDLPKNAPTGAAEGTAREDAPVPGESESQRAEAQDASRLPAT